MIDLISIHIPKTGGTSFYNILQQVYGDRLSISYKRKDYLSFLKSKSDFYQSIPEEIEVLHGHLYYQEIKSIHYSAQPKLICWLRHPVARVISNYKFFIRGLLDPTVNPSNYAANKHRQNESLMVYARRPENRNRMSSFLKGLTVEDFYFIGLLEHFEEDVTRLAKKLNWHDIDVPKLNTRTQNDQNEIDPKWVEEIGRLNNEDMSLYQSVLDLRPKTVL